MAAYVSHNFSIYALRWLHIFLKLSWLRIRRGDRRAKKMMMEATNILSLALLFLIISSSSSSSLPPRKSSRQGICIQQWLKSKQSVRQRRSQSVFQVNNVEPGAASNDADLQEIRDWMNSIPVKNDSEYLTETRAQAADSRDANVVKELPGQPTITNRFGQYAGYVDIGNGGALFYYFAEATNDPQNKPLILWFNGGPGCSSLGYGAMGELGPWRVQSDGATLRFNGYSWNQVANVLFVESPVGVGFSYTNNTADYDHLGDTPTALGNYAFLVNWFQRFTEYWNRDFYITGESYAGQYIPELAHTIVLHHEKGQGAFINLKGIMVGNGLINFLTDQLGMYTYPWTHALISDETYNGLLANCLNNVTDLCNNFTNLWYDEMGSINTYSIYAPECHNSSVKPPRQDSTYLIPGYDPCIDNHVIAYLNRTDVQDALHATGFLPNTYSLCNMSIIGKWNWSDSPADMLPIYQELMQNKYKIWVYSGDTDSNVPVTSTRESLKLLNLTITQHWGAWMSDHEVGGYKLGYDGLTFATIRGAGHEVPRFQPSRMFDLLQQYFAI